MPQRAPQNSRTHPSRVRRRTLCANGRTQRIRRQRHARTREHHLCAGPEPTLPSPRRAMRTSQATRHAVHHHARRRAHIFKGSPPVPRLHGRRHERVHAIQKSPRHARNTAPHDAVVSYL